MSKDGQPYHDTRPDGEPVLEVTRDMGDGGVRDPYLVRSPEGDKFFLIATDLSIYRRGGWGNDGSSTPGNGSTKMVVWESDDLVNWSAPRTPDVAGPIAAAGNLWAPEAVWDETRQEYFVFWATRSAPENQLGNDMNMYSAWTRDFVTFSDPEVWIDRDVQIIDTTVIKVSDWYYRASRDNDITIEKSKVLDAVSINPYAKESGSDDEWTKVGTLQSILNGTNSPCSQLNNFSGGCYEGPEFFVFNSDDVTGDQVVYGMYADLHGAGMGYKSFETVDPGSTSAADWSFTPDTEFGELKKRHGTVLPITREEYRRVLNAYSPGVVTETVTTPEIETPLGEAPTLPLSLDITMADGTTATSAVTWADISPDQYSTPGTFTVSGVLDDPLDTPVEITVTVLGPDKSALAEEIAFGRGLSDDDYTSASWADFSAALVDAELVLNDSSANQEAVDAALAALTDARLALELAPTDPTGPADPTGPVDPTGGADPTGPDGSKQPPSDTRSNERPPAGSTQGGGGPGGLVRTGAETGTILGLALIALVLGATLWVRAARDGA